MIREVQKVEFKKLPGVVFHVLALNAIEALDLQKRLKGLTEVKDLVAAQLLSYLCDELGARVLPDEVAALKFMEENRIGVIEKIVKVATDFNDLSDEAIEETLKN